jgi:hypothetical protein
MLEILVSMAPKLIAAPEAAQLSRVVARLAKTAG